MFVKENDACDYLIILGAHVNGRVPSDSLERRIRKAEQYLKSHPMTKSSSPEVRERAKILQKQKRWRFICGSMALRKNGF